MIDLRFGLCLTVQRRRDKTYILLAGELDVSNVSVLIDAFGTIPSEAQAGVVVDISKLDFLGACGINAIVIGAARFSLSLCPLIVTGANPLQHRTLIASGVGSLLASSPVPNDRLQAPLSA